MKYSFRNCLLIFNLLFIPSNILCQQDSLNFGESSFIEGQEAYYQHSGFFNLWRIGIFTLGNVSVASEYGQVGSSERDGSVFCFGTILGARLNNYLRLGGGVEYNNYPETDGMVIPIFIDLRLNFPVITSPIFFAELGYNLTQGDGLPFVNIGTGVEIGVSKRTSIFLEVAVRHYWDSYKVENFLYERGLEVTAKTTYLNLTTGVSF